MAYIGREPVYGSLVKQTLTPNGSTTTFALDYSVSTAASLLVSVGGVLQSPDIAYSVSNSTSIVFTEAPAADVDVFIIYLGIQSLVNSVADDAISAAKLAVNSVTNAKIADNAITTSKIADGNVTSAKMDTNVTIVGVMGAGSFAVGGTTVIESNRALNNISNATITGAYYESANVSASAVTANVTIDANGGGFTYFTSDASANTTVNLIGVANQPTGRAATYVLAMNNGASAKYVQAVQVEGKAANVIKWAGGSAPTSGNNSNVDVYTFTTIKTAESTYTVFASQSQFG